MSLNTFQHQVLKHYGGGDYAYIADPEYTERWRDCVRVDNSGDSLFQFIMNELADEGSMTMTRDEAVRRLERAKDDIDRMLWHIDQELKL